MGCNAARVSGAGGGAFGLVGLTVEVPLSTVLIMRSILDIARGEGEDISCAQTRLAALEVFALGGNAKSDDATESGYYAVRAALASTVSEAARHFAQKGLSGEGAPRPLPGRGLPGAPRRCADGGAPAPRRARPRAGR